MKIGKNFPRIKKKYVLYNHKTKLKHKMNEYRLTSDVGVIGPMEGVVRDGAGGLEGPGEVGTAGSVPPLVTA